MVDSLFFLLGVIGVVAIVVWYLQNRGGKAIDPGGRGLLAMTDEKSKDGEDAAGGDDHH